MRRAATRDRRNMGDGTAERLNAGLLVAADHQHTLTRRGVGPFVVPEEASCLGLEVGILGVEPVLVRCGLRFASLGINQTVL